MISAMVRVQLVMRSCLVSSHLVLIARWSYLRLVVRVIHGSRSRAAACSNSSLGWRVSRLDCA